MVSECPAEPPVDLETLTALESMGFSATKCVKAIRATGDTGVENAMNWLFEHTQDVEIDNGEWKLDSPAQ